MKEKIQAAKQHYEQIPIPPDYAAKIQHSLSHTKEPVHTTRLPYLKNSLIAASLLMATFTTTLYASEDFAKEIYTLPILGPVAKVITLNKYTEQTKDYTLDVTLPQVEIATDPIYAEELNHIIDEKMQVVLAEAKVRAAASQEAYLATGGNVADNRSTNITVDYEVTYEAGPIVSFAIHKSETVGNAYNETYYYNLDIATNQELTLEMLLGPDYEQIANAAIIEQMALRTKEEGATYFDGFQGITSTTPFYLNAQGNCVIVFAKYDIAPGSMGSQSFEIIH